jgi:predicted TIM-barrel enzyme
MMGKQFTRAEIVGKLRAKIAAGEPLVLGGAGIGLVAKTIDRAGIDVIMAYNTGPFRMDGHGSLSGYLAYGDSNAMTMDLARTVVRVVENTPVVAGIGAADPYRDPIALIDTMIELGFSGITNVPTTGLYDGMFREQIDGTKLGYPEEVKLIKACNEKDVFSLAYAFSEDECRWMAEAGADVIGTHVGLTIGGFIGSKVANDLDECCRATQRMVEAARSVNPDVMCVAHGGPFEDPQSVQRAYELTDVDGYLGASSIESLSVEKELTQVVKDFQSLRPKLGKQA